MENRESTIPNSVLDALARLLKRPQTPTRARYRELEVEIRVVDPKPAQGKLGDFLASLGPWSGDSCDELNRLLAESREAGGCEEPPAL
jgi:hypothetical protein